MDAKEFGVFIAALRKEKEMTQAELAARLNVTDKAVSRWERGLGFPDINTLEPLADVLGVSLAELMKCQRLSDAGISVKEATLMIESGIDIARYQREIRRKRMLSAMAWCIAGIVIILLAVYLHFKQAIALSLIGGADGPTAILVAGKIGSLNPIPIACAGIVLIGISVWKLIKGHK